MASVQKVITYKKLYIIFLIEKDRHFNVQCVEIKFLISQYSCKKKKNKINTKAFEEEIKDRKEDNIYVAIETNEKMLHKNIIKTQMDPKNGNYLLHLYKAIFLICISHAVSWYFLQRNLLKFGNRTSLECGIKEFWLKHLAKKSDERIFLWIQYKEFLYKWHLWCTF